MPKSSIIEIRVLDKDRNEIESREIEITTTKDISVISSEEDLQYLVDFIEDGIGKTKPCLQELLSNVAFKEIKDKQNQATKKKKH